MNITPSLPLYGADGELLGVLGVDLQLAQLGDFLQEQRFGHQGHVYVVEASGQLVASSGLEQPILDAAGKETRLRPEDSGEFAIRATDQFLRDYYGRYTAIATRDQLNFQMNGEPWFVQVTPLRDDRGLDWWIVVAIPQRDFSAEIAKNRRTTLWLCLGALAIASLVGSVTSQLLVQPLSTLRQATHDISHGAFERRLPSFAFGELADLATAFNRMAEQLQATFRDLAQRQAKLAEAQQIAHVGSWELLLDQRELSGSDELWRIIGQAKPSAGLSLRALLRSLHPKDRRRLWARARASLAQQQAFDLEVNLQRPDGRQRQLYVLGRAAGAAESDEARFYGAVMDVTEQRQAEAALRAAEAKYRGIFENAIEGIFCLSTTGEYLSVNPALARLYGYASPLEFMQRRRNNTSQYVDPQRHQEWLTAVQTHEHLMNFESEVYRADGSTIWVLENARTVRDDQGRLLHYEGNVEDVTQRRQIEAKLRYCAYYDPLTHLPNRTAFMEYLQAAIARLQVEPTAKFAVLFLDLDRFKVVNDSLGHLAGDHLLVLIANCLRTCLSLTDAAGESPLAISNSDLEIPDAPLEPTIARFGGDEFIILLPEIATVQTATAIAEQILTALRSPFDLEGNTVFVNTSIGIALSQSTSSRPETFLRNADIALYQAKARGGGSYEVFNNVMHARAVGRLQLENDLRHCLANHELTVYYQPIVAVATRRIVGFEALARWQHPFEGFISPTKFIPVAEETGLIIPLGQWILEQ
ncbi:MAG: diguanylate cyclase, partial [Spirulinaceae cyanobacterium RM2_2_10]|nr:diguanylate cyclase [Spirulinaceae cyanobacterium RM2_2_10]